jgi:hypothetical protein
MAALSIGCTLPREASSCCGPPGGRRKMISEAVVATADKYREAFQSAQPFKHVCIDDFFTRETVEASLRDIPPFDREFAIGDNGEYGGKAVVSNICEVSPLTPSFTSTSFLGNF